MFGRDFVSLANTPPCVRAGVLEIIRDNQHLAFEYSENLFGTDRYGNQLTVFEYYLQHTPCAELEASFLLILRMWKDQGVLPTRRVTSPKADQTSSSSGPLFPTPQHQSRVRGTEDRANLDVRPTLEECSNSMHRSLQVEGLQRSNSHALAHSSVWTKSSVVNEDGVGAGSDAALGKDSAIKTWERLTCRQEYAEERVEERVEVHVEKRLEKDEEEYVEECEDVCEKTFPPHRSLRDARETISALFAKGEQSEEASVREAFTEAAHLRFMATLGRPCFSALPIPDQKWSMKVYRGFTKEKDWPEEAKRSIADDIKRLETSDKALFEWSNDDMDETDVRDDVYLPEAAEKAQALLEKMLMSGEAGEPSSSTVLILKDALELRIPIQRRLVILAMAQVVFPGFRIKAGSVGLDAFLAAHRSELAKWKIIG
ncbi:hypothetical protein KC332_g1319 [Hortaea werneckii]|nr:hypothetical protein KC358_g664 [Hortaea werneckii]KAI6852663.1 hypothetical protein KC350_g700 [Hortaea werneckii]KAI6943798.1 hypothetical protein KC341_g1265 [Hortaea werneckii]KAI6950434.1 hypothetical protein KC348_g695 [Hortaea werneckii]KAI6982590.1 hypothetical protein KC321_g556 [Hortaea werneckii]